MLGQAGDLSRASQVLAFAAQSYPQDAPSEFNLALTLAKQPANEIEAVRRTSLTRKLGPPHTKV